LLGRHRAARRGKREGVLRAHVPQGFADAIGWVAPLVAGEQPNWHVTFSVADRDTTAQRATEAGGEVLASVDRGWTRTAVIRDPQGAVFTASQFTPPR
ncbi:MAG: VOC family protein, partial [Brevundimonas sp.]